MNIVRWRSEGVLNKIAWLLSGPTVVNVITQKEDSKDSNYFMYVSHFSRENIDSTVESFVSNFSLVDW
jgi:hypothetical protein